MSVISFREVLPRTFENRLGSNPSATRKFVCTTDGPTSVTDISAALGIPQGSPHPEATYLLALDASFTEPDTYHAEVSISYGMPAEAGTDSQSWTPNPLSRPAVWSYSTTGATIPVEDYYEGTGSSSTSLKPLVNSAGEPLLGVTTQVGELKVQIQVNRASFDVGAAIAGTGALNDSGYLGAPAYHWQCQGISGQPQTEAVDGVQIRFWSITSNLVYRQRGWVAQLLDTGYNCIQPDGGLGPCKVITDAGPVEASMPMALNEDGTQAFNSSGGKIEVRKIERRLHPAVNFVSYFGTPPS
jgi:hypothetical protein